MTYSAIEITDILNGPDKEEIKNVVIWIAQEAAKGDARANYMIALWHRDGLHGFAKSKRNYNTFVKVAVDRLLPAAIYDFGVSKDGKSIEESKKALGYYILAAILGDDDALDALINHFIYGTVLERNDFVAAALKKHRDHLLSQATVTE